MNRKSLEKIFSLQQDQADCGVACLLSIIRFYSGSSSLEVLRNICGTTGTGTTLLGLYTGASKIGFDVKGVELDIETLFNQQSPCILNVVTKEGFSHFIVYFGKDVSEGKYVIGDPAKGIQSVSEADINSFWTKMALLMEPNADFVRSKSIKKSMFQIFKSLLINEIDILYAALFLSLIIAVLGLSSAIFSQKLIDNILPSGNPSLLKWGFILLCLVMILRAFLIYLRQHFLLIQGRAFNSRISESFFNALLFLPKTFFDSRNKGDMTSRLNDILKIQTNIAYITGTTAIDVLVIIFSVSYIVFYSVSIASVLLTFIPIISFIAYKYSKPLKAIQREAMNSHAENESNYYEVIEGVISIKSNNLQPAFLEKGKMFIANFQDKLFKLGLFGNRLGIIYECLGITYNMLAVGMSAYMVLKHQLKIGEMIAISSMANSLIPAVSRLSQINLQIQESIVAFDRMTDLTLIEPEFVGELTEIDDINHIAFNNVSFGFPGRKQLLHHLDFTVVKGEIIAVIGQSGSGKSTLLQLIEKFYTISSGQVLIDTFNINNLHVQSLRKHVSYISQEVDIFNGSVLYNISLNEDKDALASAYELCIKYDFNRYFKDLPQNYATVVGAIGINLSGGQKQLIAFARAILSQPKVMLLDEATSSMDNEMEEFIVGIIEKVKSTMIIIITTHKTNKLSIADRVYKLADGRLILP